MRQLKTKSEKWMKIILNIVFSLFILSSFIPISLIQLNSHADEHQTLTSNFYPLENDVLSKSFQKRSQKNIKDCSNRTSAFKETTNRDYIVTPNGSGVEVWYFSEMSAEEIVYWNQIGDSQFPNATRIGDSSAVYNCHSYAWHMQSTSNPYWMPNPYRYYEDGTYEEVSGIGDVGDIICYFDSNNQNIHSGIVIGKTIGVSNNVCGNSDLVTVRSKWGEWALYEHQGDQCPYTGPYGGSATYVKYFRPHINETISISNPNNNSSQTIERNNYVTQYVYGQTDYYAMFRLNISSFKTYSFEITVNNYYLDVRLYEGLMHEVSINSTTIYENGICQVSFSKYMNHDYYLRVSLENTYENGTIHTKIINPHSHSYNNDYFWYNLTLHRASCICGTNQLEPHVISTRALGNQYSTCLLCGGLASIGMVGPFSTNEYPRTQNGSFILPNGVVALVDEDISGYLNGTLMFISSNTN